MEMMIGPYGAPALQYAALFQDIKADTAWFHGFDEKAFEICENHGINACVEFAVFRADYNLFPHLKPIGIDGKPIRHGENLQGICLSNPDFLEKIENGLKSGLTTYSPKGIWLDYLTYGGWFEDPSPDLQDSCFCSKCVEHFNETTEIDEKNPQRIVSLHKEAWVNYKCRRIAQFAVYYASIIRRMQPDTIIGIYMCPYTPQEYDGALRSVFAQDYVLLAPSVDIFTPLIYCAKSGRDAGWGRTFLESSSAFVPADKGVQLILDAKDFPASMEQTVESSVPSMGLQMFSGFQIFQDKTSMETFARCADILRS